MRVDITKHEEQFRLDFRKPGKCACIGFCAQFAVVHACGIRADGGAASAIQCRSKCEVSADTEPYGPDRGTRGIPLDVLARLEVIEYGCRRGIEVSHWRRVGKVVAVHATRIIV